MHEDTEEVATSPEGITLYCKPMELLEGPEVTMSYAPDNAPETTGFTE